MLFNKVLVISDAHYGRHGNNPLANQDNNAFLDWAIDRAKSWGAETCIFMGDWHDNRTALLIPTIHESLKGMKKLNDSFKIVYFEIGNHDCYKRADNSINSVVIGQFFPNIKIISDPLTIEDVTFLPWLVGDQHKMIKHIKSRYVFGHLELPGFISNYGIEVQNADHLAKPEDFIYPEYTFTGHFHARNTKKNIVYTGNMMPFSFSDQNDSERGIMLLEYGKDPIFESWPDQPLYTTVNLTTLLNDEKKYLKPKSTVKIIIDLPVSHTDIQEMKDIFSKTYDLRKIQAHQIDVEEIDEFKEEVQFKDVDQMFMEGLQSVDSKGLNNDKLIGIYQKLCE